MQLAIATPALVTETTTSATEIKWVAKGGSSINSADGRFALRKNSKGTWKVVDNGTVRKEDLTKEQAKLFAETLVEVSTTDLKAALLAGEAKVYSVRSNGTMRRRHFLTGADLVAAQAVAADRASGKGLAVIASSLHVSISHVRRMMVDLAITQELTEMDNSQLEAMLVGAAEDN